MATAPKKASKPKSRFLTPAQKAEAIALWRAGEVTLDELATKFKKNRTTFVRLFEKEGVKKGEAAEEARKKVTEAVEGNIANDAAIYAQRIKDTKEEHYKMASGVAKLTWATIAAARNKNQPLGAISGDLKSLMIASQTLKITREERYAVLGIDASDSADDRPLPELIVQELTAEDIEEMQKAQMMGEDEEFDMDLGDEDLVNAAEGDRVETE